MIDVIIITNVGVSSYGSSESSNDCGGNIIYYSLFHIHNNILLEKPNINTTEQEN